MVKSFEELELIPWGDAPNQDAELLVLLAPGCLKQISEARRTIHERRDAPVVYLPDQADQFVDVEPHYLEAQLPEPVRVREEQAFAGTKQ